MPALRRSAVSGDPTAFPQVTALGDIPDMPLVSELFHGFVWPRSHYTC